MTESTSSAPLGSRVTAILSAMPEEAVAVRALLRNVRSLKGLPNSWHGQLGHRHVVLAVTGDGERKAREGAAQLFAALSGRIDRLLILGVSGALSPWLRVGDLVVAREVRAEVGGSPIQGDRALADVAIHCANALPSVAVSSANIADTREEKQRLLAFSQVELKTAERTAAVVDLESFAYAAAAEKAAVPWLILRAISDTADEAIPPLLNRSRDAGGSVQRSRVARGLLTDPMLLPKLLTLRKRVARASEQLAQAAAAVLGHAGAAHLSEYRNKPARVP
jgi:nucleoside phosphorylase